jgi:hypothetical protein
MTRLVPVALALVAIGLTGNSAVASDGKPTKPKLVNSRYSKAELDLQSEIAVAIKRYFSANFSDGDARVWKAKKKNFEPVAKRFNGRQITMRFPILETSDQESKYVLRLDDPAFSGGRQRCRYPSHIAVKMTKEQSLRLGRHSELEVSGRIRVELKSSENAGDFAKSLGRSFAWWGSGKSVTVFLSLEKPSLKIVATGKKTDEPSTSVSVKWLKNLGTE